MAVDTQRCNTSSKVALQYLRYVLAAAEKRSFRQAAIELGVWESTVSRGIRDLEDEIGVEGHWQSRVLRNDLDLSQKSHRIRSLSGQLP
jgi:hypothetical protein